MLGSVFQVKLIRLVGIMLLLYVKQEHAAHISEVEAETVGTGIMGRMVSSCSCVWHSEGLDPSGFDPASHDTLTACVQLENASVTR